MIDGVEFRFTLSNPVDGVLPIDEPVGWDKSDFTLTRGEKFHSLIFEYGSSLRFYYRNSVVNGGAEFIEIVENREGPDGVVRILVEVRHHSTDWEVVQTGRLNLEDIVFSEGFVECSIEQDDFFTTFNQRSNLKVSLGDNTSVDGVALQTYEPYELTMHSKVLVKRTEASNKTEIIASAPMLFQYKIAGSIPLPPNVFYEQEASQKFYVQFGLDSAAPSELIDYYNVGAGIILEEPPEVYGSKESGRHDVEVNLNFDITLRAYDAGSYSVILGCGSNYDGSRPDGSFVIPGRFREFELRCFFKVYSEDDVEKYSNEFLFVPTPSELEDCSTVEHTISDIQANFTLLDYALEVGDKMKVFAECYTYGNYRRQTIFDATLAFDVDLIINKGSFIRLTGRTQGVSTKAMGMRIHDIFQAITNKITNRNDSFYSELFGYPGAPYHDYSSKGCFADYVLESGLNLRGFPWNLRPLQVAFNDLFDGLNAIVPLSLSLEEIGGVPRIRIEHRDYVYNKEPILVLEGISGLRKTIAKNLFFNQIEIGYERGLPEGLNGLDEINTSHTYATSLKTIGKPLVLKSKLIASGSIIEVVRRVQYDGTITTDTEYDNELFIIALNHNNPTIPEKNENFDIVNNLLSPETSYNLRLWPAFNLLRHGSYINGPLLKKIGSEYIFTAGEGNYKVEMKIKLSELTCPGFYNGELLIGGTNIKWAYADVSETEPAFIPYEFEFDFPIGLYDLAKIRANKGNALLINGDIHGIDEFQTVFILDLKNEPTTSRTQLKCIGASTIPFNYVPEDSDNLIYNDGINLLYEDGGLILIN